MILQIGMQTHCARPEKPYEYFYILRIAFSSGVSWPDWQAQGHTTMDVELCRTLCSKYALDVLDFVLNNPGSSITKIIHNFPSNIHTTIRRRIRELQLCDLISIIQLDTNICIKSVTVTEKGRAILEQNHSNILNYTSLDCTEC